MKRAFKLSLNRDRDCDSFNVFVDAALDGRVDLHLSAAYQQLTEDRTSGISWVKAFNLVLRPGFQVNAINDAACRMTPLDVSRTTLPIE